VNSKIKFKKAAGQSTIDDTAEEFYNFTDGGLKGDDLYILHNEGFLHSINKTKKKIIEPFALKSRVHLSITGLKYYYT